MTEIRYGIDEIAQVAGQPYRLGFVLAEMREPRPVDRILFRHRRKASITLGPLFHYTSLAGFQGIVGDAGFWASDNRFMNDTEEFAHGVMVALRVLDHCIRRTRHAQYAGVLVEVRHGIESRPEGSNLIACFSLAEDSLEQWRGYGSSGGVCIEVGGMAKAEGTRPAFYGPDMLPKRVVYDDRTKAILVLQAIRLFEDEYIRDRLAMPAVWPSDHDTEYAKTLTSKILYLAALFKSKAFKREKEVRIVFSHANANQYGGLAFRTSPLGLIPYINTGKRTGVSGRIPIGRVIVGPSPHQHTVLQSVRTFLDHKGYCDTPIFPSRVPYRSY